MSTWEMFKFWLIRETMPLFVFLGIIAAFFLVIFCWATVECLVNDFKRWRKKKCTNRKR
jgi:hypothetical protein